MMIMCSAVQVGQASTLCCRLPPTPPTASVERRQHASKMICALLTDLTGRVCTNAAGCGLRNNAHVYKTS